jgi:hypothetical protein
MLSSRLDDYNEAVRDAVDLDEHNSVGGDFEQMLLYACKESYQL